METNATLMRGDKVTIYQDPLTEKKPEGKATLSTYIATDGDLERWKVRFDGEREVFERWIKKSDAA